MRFWFRELAGWVLVLLGLFVFYICLSILLTPGPYILEAGSLTLVGIIVFRGGIHLLKVAVAARVCLHADREAFSREPLASAPPSARQRLAVKRSL
jgi:hypothetical protein